MTMRSDRVTGASLTERRRAETRAELSRVAAGMFASKGYAATSVEEIADEAGVGLRTFYRYFPTKADAVLPILTGGAARWQEAVAALMPGPVSVDRVAAVVREALTPADDDGREQLARIGRLVRAADEDEDLRRIWHHVNGESERRLRAVFAEAGTGGDDPALAHLQAAVATDAIRIALEVWSGFDGDNPPETPGERAERCYRRLAGTLLP